MLFTLLDAPKAEICHMKLAKWLLEHFPLLKTGDPKRKNTFQGGGNATNLSREEEDPELSLEERSRFLPTG